MTPPEFAAIFVLGVISSLHCVQMCGPIVLAYSLPLAKAARRPEMLMAHAAYSVGRVTTYSALGAVAGVAGGGLNLVSRLGGVANGARICAGLGMIVAAVLISGVLPQPRLVQIGPVGWFSRVVGRILLSPTPQSKLRLGLVLGLLPCGLVYAALIKSAETGTAVDGALTMLAFGLGTASTLTSFGIVSSAAGMRLGRWGNALSAAGVALMGAFLLWRSFAGPMHHAHHG